MVVVEWRRVDGMESKQGLRGIAQHAVLAHSRRHVVMTWSEVVGPFAAF